MIDLRRCAAIVMVAMLAGCGRSQVAPIGITSTAAASHGQSWMKPGSSSGDLLYVDSAEEVAVLTYPRGQLVGKLTGFKSAEALCADKSGDVFIPDADAADIVEYAHGGTSPLQTLQDSGRPSACSVDPTTGNLAVSNLDGFVSVYKNAKGTAETYSAPVGALFCAYDSNGDLFVSEPSESSGTVMAELPRGGSSFESITLGRGPSDGYPAGLQWYGKNLVFGHSGPGQYNCCGKLYRIIVDGTQGKSAGHFAFARTDISDFFIYGSTAIVAVSNDVAFYTYPGLKQQTKNLDAGGYGVVVSPASSGNRVHR